MSKVISFLVLIAVVIGGYVLLKNADEAAQPSPEGVACTLEAKICPDGTAVGRTGPNCEFAACPSPEFLWTFADTPSGDDGIPHTEVSVVLNDRTFLVGSYEGSCVDKKGSQWSSPAGELAGAVCWFAGGGSELGVYLENNTYVVKHRFIEEGTAETPPPSAEFKTILELK